MSPKSANEVDKYISSFPEDVRERLQTLRKTILAEIPEAEEKLGYGIPTYKLNGNNIVHFGGFKNHVGFYPTPSGLTTFADELEKYKVSKGTAQFPHDKPLPLTLVKKIVKFRVKEENEKSVK